ncbi:MAG: excinuclease ABC subunit UvrC [Candidatus Omnitrophota bacterium]|jgi:excinuclease ABC subunit C
MDIKKKVKALPATPGVYIMKSEGGEVLYVGKAGNLKKRVSSYFQRRGMMHDRIGIMSRQVRDIEYISTKTEAEALIYENGLIKQLLPKYNVALKDGKGYPMLKLTVGEKFPRLFITRQRKDDGSIHYGPYTDAKLLKKALISLRQVFPLRSCGKMKKNVCLNYHIKQCLGPCAGNISESDYGQIVSELKLYLEGKRTELLKVLSEKMISSSVREKFEDAAKYKARIEALSVIGNQAVSYKPSGELDELASILGIKGKLDAIEAFDVSNIMGELAVGSMVYFRKGRPGKDEYRKFKIKTVSGIDDYAMMREIVKRRYSRLMEEKRPLPDLVLIDGGKGHLAAAMGELERLGLSKIPVIGIAKEFEHIYVKNRKDPIILPKESKALHLLERIRDEAHRFAISYHRKLMSKRIRER